MIFKSSFRAVWFRVHSEPERTLHALQWLRGTVRRVGWEAGSFVCGHVCVWEGLGGKGGWGGGANRGEERERWRSSNGPENMSVPVEFGGPFRLAAVASSVVGRRHAFLFVFCFVLFCFV